MNVSGPRAAAIVLVCLAALTPLSVAAAEENDDPAGGAALDGDARQILPPSPVAGGNDPNASDDVLYILEANDEEAARTRRLGRKAHVFVNPQGRLAAATELSPGLKIEVFGTGGLAAFEKPEDGFGARTSSAAAGFNATGDLGLLNAVVAYEHRNARTEFFGPWAAKGDKVGATLNKTYPLFVRNLGVTPQVLVSDDVVDPFRSSSAKVEATVGLTYDASQRVSFAVSTGYEHVFIYNVPGYRHDSGLKLIVGTTLKPIDSFVLTFGSTTTRTEAYGGTPLYRADGSISPVATAKYMIFPGLTASLAASYGRFVSTATGQGTFKYNINPSLSLTVPL